MAIKPVVKRLNPAWPLILYDAWLASIGFHLWAENSQYWKFASCCEEYCVKYECKETDCKLNWLLWRNWRTVENGVKLQSFICFRTIVLNVIELSCYQLLEASCLWRVLINLCAETTNPQQMTLKASWKKGNKSL